MKILCNMQIALLVLANNKEIMLNKDDGDKNENDNDHDKNNNDSLSNKDY